MKRLFSILLCLSILSVAFAQDPETKLKALESKDSSLVNQSDTLKKNQGVSTKSDSTKIRIGNKSITIIDNDDNTIVRFPNRRHYSTWDFEYSHNPSFRGHWAGVEFGINGFVDKNQSLTMKNDMAWLDLKQARSWNFNINFMQYSVGFGTDKIGLVTGMGLEFNNYHFSKPISLKVENEITVVDSSYIKNGFEVQKSKLSTTTLTIPLLLEFQIPTGEHGHRIFISGGVIGGLRVGDHTKVIYDDKGKRKDKNHEDFNLSTFRYGFTARVGFKGLKLFANYYPTPLFEKNKGPEIYPFSVGLILFNFSD